MTIFALQLESFFSKVYFKSIKQKISASECGQIKKDFCSSKDYISLFCTRMPSAERKKPKRVFNNAEFEKKMSTGPKRFLNFLSSLCEFLAFFHKYCFVLERYREKKFENGGTNFLNLYVDPNY